MRVIILRKKVLKSFREFYTGSPFSFPGIIVIQRCFLISLPYRILNTDFERSDTMDRQAAANAYEHVRYFAEECGERLAGEPSVIKASDYIRKEFEDYGVDEVELHEFKQPICKLKKSEVRIKIGQEWKTIAHTPVLFAKSTPEEGLTLPLVYCEDGSEFFFEENDVKGKAVLICRDAYLDYPDLYMYRRLYKYGAAAVFYTSSDGHKDIPYVYANYEYMDEPFTIPTAILSYDDAIELAKAENAEIFYNCQMDVTWGTTRNTVGYITGSEPEKGNILVCAHLDNAVSSFGAADDGGGVACVMEMARYYANLKKQGKAPKRTLIFIAWSGHECGLNGSKNYVLDHPQIIRDMKFVFNYDIIGNALSSPLIWAGCNEEVEAEMNDIVKKCRLDWLVDVGPWIVDTVNFAGQQIPHLTLTSGFYAINHTKYDNLSFLSKEGFISPLHFSEAMLNYLIEKDEISQGYPPELYDAMEYYGNKFGWGFFKK